ncbi:MAG: cysteine hydrolase, partial [Mycobacteriales bacterium]
MTIAPSDTALVVVDMQNDFGSEGGMFHRAGIPIDGIQAAVAPTARAVAAARRAAIPIVYLKMQFEPDLSDAGGPDAPNLVLHRRFGVGDTVPTPGGGEGRTLVRDTWGTDIVAELAPQQGDIIVAKHRFSGFFETDLDATLTSLGVTSLVFTGCTTTVCVESTLRDAFFRDYRCLLLEDCAAEPIGGDLARGNHEASVLVIQTLFGWVSESAAFEAGLREREL